VAKKDAAPAAPAPPPPPADKKPLLVALLNTIVVMAAGGMFVYTQVLYKRPQITEESERVRLAEVKASPKPPPKPELINFEPITVNIAPSPGKITSSEETDSRIQGKLHYIRVGFALEINDATRKEVVESIRPLLTDRMLTLLGRKQYHELVNVQGRYVLRNQIMDTANQLVTKRMSGLGKDGLISQVYFTEFTVQ